MLIGADALLATFHVTFCMLPPGNVTAVFGEVTANPAPLSNTSMCIESIPNPPNLLSRTVTWKFNDRESSRQFFANRLRLICQQIGQSGENPCRTCGGSEGSENGALAIIGRSAGLLRAEVRLFPAIRDWVTVRIRTVDRR